MKNSKSIVVKLVVVIIFLAALAGGAVLAKNMLFGSSHTQNAQQQDDNKDSQSANDDGSAPENTQKQKPENQNDEKDAQSNDSEIDQSGESDLDSSQSPRSIVNRLFGSSSIIRRLVSGVTGIANRNGHVAASDAVSYDIRYIDAAGKKIEKISKQGKANSTIEIKAADLFSKGYEIYDDSSKTIKLDKPGQEVVFKYRKARELMPLEEFVKEEVDYSHPIKFRNLDFTNRQKDLEDFVVKKIFYHERDTGVFYGTKDQAEQVRKTMLNGSFHGSYFRYATDLRDMIPKHISGDKYELKIEFVYQEYPENIELGEKKVTEFYNKYGKLNLTDAAKAKLAQDWLIKNVKVFNPPSAKPEWFTNNHTRRVHFPASAMIDKEGVCLSYAMTYARLIERLGLDVRVVQGYFGLNVPPIMINKARKMLENPDTTTYNYQFFNHTWNLVKIEGKWHHIDVYHDLTLLASTKGYEDPHHHFLQSDEFMREHKIELGPIKRKAKYNIYKAWNTNRIPAAPESRNELKKTLPNIVESNQPATAPKNS